LYTNKNAIGESGSGKTESTNFLLHHLTALSQKGSQGCGVEQTILSAGPVLEVRNPVIPCLFHFIFSSSFSNNNNNNNNMFLNWIFVQTERGRDFDL
jgi:hypothetical protein